MSPILGLPDSFGYGDKRGRNKRFGPGGGTRRLHQTLTRLAAGSPEGSRQAQRNMGAN
jgi:hypothetical protein